MSVSGQNGQKWSEHVQSGQKLSEHVQSGHNGQKCSGHVLKNGEKWSEHDKI